MCFVNICCVAFTTHVNAWSVNERLKMWEFSFSLQVVRIQVQIQETLRRQYSQHPSVQGAISQLDSQLMDITKVSHHRIRWVTGTDFSHIKLTCFFCYSYMESLQIISGYLNASWPSFTVLDTRTLSWFSLCGKRYWKKVCLLNKTKCVILRVGSLFVC